MGEKPENQGKNEKDRQYGVRGDDQRQFGVPAGKEKAYTNAIYDCNDIIIPYKKGLLIVTGPIGYGAGLVIDAATTPRKFQKSMETMGFKCLKDKYIEPI